MMTNDEREYYKAIFGIDDDELDKMTAIVAEAQSFGVAGYFDTIDTLMLIVCASSKYTPVSEAANLLKAT
jgi:hypothetical protein